MRGRTIKLYIMSEQYKHLKTAELSNWTGKAYIGQRKHVNLLQQFEELAAPGVYFYWQILKGLIRRNSTLEKRTKSTID